MHFPSKYLSIQPHLSHIFSIYYLVLRLHSFCREKKKGTVRRDLIFLYACLGSALTLAAAPAIPALETVYPISIPKGATSSVTLIGKFDPWPPKLWTDAPGLEFTFSTNAGQIQIIASSNSPIGPHLLRAYNDLGASEPRFLLIDAMRRVQQIAEHIGVRAIEVDSIDATAQQFYLKFGFTLLLDDPHHLYLPMSAIRALKLPPH